MLSSQGPSCVRAMAAIRCWVFQHHLVAHQMPRGVVSPRSFDFVRDGCLMLVGEGSNSVLQVAQNTHENLGLPIDFPIIIVHAPLSTCSLVVHVNSPSLAMDMSGNSVDYDGSLESFGSQAPPCCPHEVSCARHVHLFSWDPPTLPGICCIVWGIEQVYTWIWSCTWVNANMQEKLHIGCTCHHSMQT